ncbi:MAG: signal peptidase I [Oscillospiraceae bacterium]|nr:signal peptidase I [Oscillospiraceae bacterium]
MNKKTMWLKIFHILAKIIGVILIIIALIIITMNISMYIEMNKDKSKLPSFFGYKEIVIAGKSMEPTLNVGDIVIAKVVDEYSERNVIVYRDKNNAVITHRIIEIEEKDGQTMYITKGDANNSQDTPITKDKIEGVMIFQLSGWGKAIAFLKSPNGLLLLIGIPVIYILITRYTSAQFYKKQIKRKQERIEHTNEHNGK